jgi:hypothetical protein
MKSIRHTMVLGLSACALTLISVGAWGATSGAITADPMPLLQAPQTPQTQPPDTPKQDEAKSATFTGTVVKQGDSYVLRASTGTVYQLDDPSRAQQFEGKSVTVSGKLDAQSKMIHVDSIAEAGA